MSEGYMRKLNLILSLLLVTSPVYAGFDSFMKDVKDKASEASDSISGAVTDSGITLQIKTKLGMEKNIPFNISVTTEDKIVSLKGTVDTGLQADKIADIAKSVDGVRGLNTSELKVTPSKDYFKDAGITAKTKLAISKLSSEKKIRTGARLHIETTNGNVYIFGSLQNKAELAQVEDTVKEVEGVNDIFTNITFKDKG